MSKTTARQDAKAAARALANLNAWGSVVELMEGGLLAGAHVSTPIGRVVKIAKAEIQKELKRYDKALASVEQKTR